jgi:hypothetical protein
MAEINYSLSRENLKEEIIDKVEQLKKTENLDDILDLVDELLDEETQEILARFKARKNN